MEAECSKCLCFNQTDKSILDQYIGKECEIILRKLVYSKTFGNSSSFKGIIEKIGNRVVLIRMNYKKKDYPISVFMSDINSIVLL